MAEAIYATEHRHRRCCRCAPAGDRLGSGNRRDRARAARPVPHCLPVDAAAFLGALAQSGRRIRPRGRPHAAGRCWKSATTRQILIYSLLLLPVSVLPWALGFAGTIYGAVAAAGGAIFVMLAVQLRRSPEDDRHA